jgi:hypothetical protein
MALYSQPLLNFEGPTRTLAERFGHLPKLDQNCAKICEQERSAMYSVLQTFKVRASAQDEIVSSFLLNKRESLDAVDIAHTIVAMGISWRTGAFNEAQTICLKRIKTALRKAGKI